MPPQGPILGVWRVLTWLPAQVPSALQALKKDEAVPWTGMLAIVRSYVTHKTGRTRARAPAPFSPPPGPLEAVLARTLKRGPWMGPVQGSSWEDGLPVPMRPARVTAPVGGCGLWA